MAEGGGTARTLQGRLWDLPFGLLHLYTDALGRVWRLTMDGVGAAEHLASAAFGAAIGGSQGFVIACVRLLPFKPTPPPVVRRLLPSLPLLVGSTAEAEGRTGGPAEQAEVQVIGMGAGYTLNVASAEAAPEPPSPQFVPSARAEGELGVEAAGGVPAGKAEFIRRKEEGIGTAAPRAPQTPVVGAAPTYAPYSPERPGLTEAPHAFGERYVGHEVEPLGTELQGPEEPSLPAAGGAVNGPSRAGEGVAAAVSPRRARLEAMFRETQDLRAHTTETLRKAEQLPGRVEGEATGPGALEEAALPVAVAGGAAAGAAAAGPPRLERITPPLEPMPADMISGEEGRAASPALEALPEGSEEAPPCVEFLQGTPHAGLKRPPSLPLEAQAVEQPAAGEAPGAEARLRGLFAPVPVLIPVPGGGAARMAPPGMPAEGGAAGAAPGPAATGAVTGYEPGSTGLLGGRQGERVVVQRMMLPGMGAAEAELPAERVSKGEEGAAVAEAAPAARQAGAGGRGAARGAAAQHLMAAATAVAAEAVRSPAPARHTHAAAMQATRQRRLLRRLSAAAAAVTGSTTDSGSTAAASAWGSLKQLLLGLAAVAMMQSRLLGTLAAAAVVVVVVVLLLSVLVAEVGRAAAQGALRLAAALRIHPEHETAATAPAAGAVPAAGAELEGAGLAGEAPAGEALEAAPEEVPPAAAAAEAPGEATPGPPAAEGVEQAAGRVPAAGEEPLAVEEPAAAAAKELAAEEERAPEAKLMGPEPEVPAGEVPPPVEKEPSLAAAPPTPARPSEVAAAEPGTSAFAAPAAAEAKPPVPPAAASKAAPAVPAAPAAAAATAPTAGAPVKKKKKGRGPLHKVAKEFRKIFFTPPS